MRIDPASKRFLDQNKGYTCVECSHIFKSSDMYYVMMTGISFKICKTCLFNMGLMFNDMFEFQPLLDGTDQYTINTVYRDLNIPETVYKSLLKGKYIQAIKDWRDIQGTYLGEDGKMHNRMGLKDAKEQIDTWREVVKPYLQDTDPVTRQGRVNKPWWQRP